MNGAGEIYEEMTEVWGDVETGMLHLQLPCELRGDLTSVGGLPKKCEFLFLLDWNISQTYSSSTVHYKDLFSFLF